MQSDTADLDRHDLTITEMSQLYGVSLRALRFYEEVGLIAPRRVGIQRFYSSREKVLVEMILAGKRFGFSLREIGDLLQSHQARNKSGSTGLADTLDRGAIEQQLTSLEQQRADIDAVIAELAALLADSDQSR